MANEVTDPSNTRCASVLIVEDDADIRESLEQVLAFEGYDVQKASNGKEALELLRDSPQPCLILLDLMMPVMDGWDFLKHKRDCDSLATIPVIITSAIADKAKDQQSEVKGFIKKPIDLEIMLSFVRKFCAEACPT